MNSTQQGPIRNQKPIQYFPIIQLFEMTNKGILRAEILKLFAIMPDEGRILSDVKTEVFSTTSIIPEAILHPDLRPQFFRPSTHIDLSFKNSRKEQVKYLPMKELFKAEVRVPERGNINDLFNNTEIRHNIEDLFNKDDNTIEKKISDLFKKNENEVSPIDGLFEKESSTRRKLDFTPERPQALLKQRSEIKQLFDSTVIDINQGNTKINQLFDNNKEINPFSEYAGVNKNEKVWYYKDLKGKEQGPFSSLEMNQWNNANYLHNDLLIRLIWEDTYKPLSSILKTHGTYGKVDDIFNEVENSSSIIEIKDIESVNTKLSSLFK